MDNCSLLKKFIAKNGGQWIAFREPTTREERISKERALPPEHRAHFLAELAKNPSPSRRYQLEYENGIYRSFKPGLDDNPELILGKTPPHQWFVIEIGGGPAYLAEHGRAGSLCLDIAEHPRLSKFKVCFVEGDIVDPNVVERCAGKAGQDQRLVALSYCLDRVSDQRLAIRHFAQLLRSGSPKKSLGLVTVCLPAMPASPGVSTVSYGGGAWITNGKSALGDYRAIVKACKMEGLSLRSGGLTCHLGVSLDGFEKLPCYVMVFEPN